MIGIPTWQRAVKPFCYTHFCIAPESTFLRKHTPPGHLSFQGEQRHEGWM